MASGSALELVMYGMRFSSCFKKDQMDKVGSFIISRHVTDYLLKCQIK